MSVRSVFPRPAVVQPATPTDRTSRRSSSVVRARACVRRACVCACVRAVCASSLCLSSACVHLRVYFAPRSRTRERAAAVDKTRRWVCSSLSSLSETTMHVRGRPWTRASREPQARCPWLPRPWSRLAQTSCQEQAFSVDVVLAVWLNLWYRMDFTCFTLVHASLSIHDRNPSAGLAMNKRSTKQVF